MSEYEHDYPGDDYHEFYADPENGGPVIAVTKVGGGTVGREYAGAWHYVRWVDGKVTHRGSDLVSGTPHTHAHMAEAVEDFAQPDA